MDRLLPAPSPSSTVDDPALDGPALDDSALVDAYAYPEGLTAPFVRVNFVSSADGAVSVDGVSGGLGDDADKRVFSVLRRLADVILVGAGTARAEGYRGARRDRIGGDAPPPIAVVTGSCDLDPASGLFTDTRTPPLVLTTASAEAGRRAALSDAGADVVTLPDLSPATLLAEMGARGLHRVLCEGGPSLHGAFVADDRVDELCLTLAPLLVAGDAGRIASGPAGSQRLRLAHALHEDGTLLLRYVRSSERA